MLLLPKMGPTKRRRVRKIKVLSLGTHWQIYSGRGRRGRQERGRKKHRNREKTTHSAEEGVAEKCAKADRGDIQINTEARGGNFFALRT